MKLIQMTIFIVLTALGAQPLQAATATIESLSGSPKIFEIGDTGAREVSLPRKGAEYRLPIEVETGPGDSALFRLPDSEVSVAPNSIMRINAPEARESGLFQRILQKTGTSFFSVDRRTVEHFEVQTPYLTSVVKGTVFNVVVHDTGATVALHEGRLLVTSPDGAQSVTLLPGDVAFSTDTGLVRKLGRSVARQSTLPDAGREAEVPAAEAARETALAAVSGSESSESTLESMARVADVTTELALPDTGLADTLSDATGAADLNTDVVAPQLAETTSDLIGGVPDLADTVMDPLVDTSTSLVGDTVDGAGDLVADLGGTTGDLVGGLGGTAGDLVGDVGGAAGDLTGDLVPPAGDLLTDVGGATGDLVGDVGNATGDLVGDVGPATGDLVGDVGAATGDLVGDVGASTGDLLGDVGGAAGDLLDDTGGVAGDLLGDTGGTAGDLVGDSGGAGGTGTLDTTVGGAFDGLGGGLENLGGVLPGLFP